MASPRRQAPAVVVWAAAIGFACVAAYFSIRRNEAFRSGFDLANLDQVLWLLANLHEPFDTQTGRLFWGEHFSPTIGLLTPVYALGAGPTTLLVVQALAMASVAPLLFALARAYGAGPWLAVVPALLWLLSPLTLIPTVNDVHHVPLTAPLLVGSILALRRERLVVFAILALLASSAKEDVSLTYVMLGVVVALEGRRRLGAAISLTALYFFVFAVVVFMPLFSDSLWWFERRFAGDRGESVSDVVVWIASHPISALGDLLTLQNTAVCAALVLTTGGLCLLAPRWMLLGTPVLAHNLLTAYSPQHGIRDHYHVPVALAFAIAAAVGVHRLALAGARARMLAAAGVTLAALLFPLGLIVADHESEWSTDTAALTGGAPARRALVTLIPDDVPVAASTRLSPHLAHRRELYTLPLPFFGGEEIGVDWSPTEMERRAAGVRWVILDTNDVLLENPRTRELMGPVLERLGFRRIARQGTVSVHTR